MPEPVITTKPMRSQAQWRWAWANGMPFAKRWSEATPGGKGKRFRKLPGHVAKKAIYSNPGQLCPYCTADLALPRDGWYRCGNCQKALYASYTDSDFEDYHAFRADRLPKGAPPQPQTLPTAEVLTPPRTTTEKAPNYHAHAGETIAGNLGRGQDGKFSAAGNASAAKPKPKKVRGVRGLKPKKAAKPKLTPEQRQQAHDAQKAKNRVAVQGTLKNGPNKEGWDTLQAMREGKDVDPGMAQALADETGLVEKDATGHYRLSTDGTHLLNAADRGDAGDANVAVSRGQDRLARQDARADRQTAAQQRHAAVDQRRQERAAAVAKRVADREAAKKKKLEEKPKGGGGGGGGKKDKGPSAQDKLDQQLALLGRLVRGKTRKYKALRVVEHGGYTILGNATLPEAYAHAVKYGEVSQDWLERLIDQGYAYQSGSGYALRGQDEIAQQHPDLPAKLESIRETRRPDLSSFKVFKDAKGQYRWVALSSNAYQDRDGEIVSTKALTNDVARADKDGKYGPLRWWHEGNPQPLDPDAPWGPGVDLGWCDFNAMSGRVLVESGTFRTPEIGAMVAAKADNLGISIGFIHPPSEPESGVFHTIKRFERSLAPRERVSNPFTSLHVSKENTMAMPPEKIAALKALGVDDAMIATIDQRAATTEKTATDQGVRFKTADDQAGLMRQMLALKAKGYTDEQVIDLMETFKAPFPPEEEEKAPPAPGAAAEDLADGGADDDLEDGTGELDPATFVQMIVDGVTQALAPVLGLSQKMDDLKGHFTAMGSTVAKKDAADAERDQTIATLKTQIEQATTKLKELEGDQPAQHVRPSESFESALTALGMKALQQGFTTPQAPQSPVDAIAAGLPENIFGSPSV